MCLQIIYSMNTYEENLDLNKVELLICHKAKLNQIKSI